MPSLSFDDLGQSVTLQIDPERVDKMLPDFDEVSSSTKSQGDQNHEYVHWRTDQKIVIGLRALTNAEVACWMHMVQATADSECQLDLRPHLPWADIEYAVVKRMMGTKPVPDGFQLWSLKLTFELVFSLK